MTISRKAAEEQMDQKTAPMTIEARLRFLAEMYKSNESCKKAGLPYSEKLMQFALEQIEKIVSESVTIPRNPVDRDDVAILDAAKAVGYPNAVMVGTQTDLAYGTKDLTEMEADAQEFKDVKFGSKQWFDNINEISF